MGFGAATALGSAGTARHSTLRARGGAAECNAPSTSASAEAQAFIDSVNLGYERVHRDFEAQFWGTKMALSEEHRALSGDRASYSVGELTATKGRMEDFLADEAKATGEDPFALCNRLAAGSDPESDLPVFHPFLYAGPVPGARGGFSAMGAWHSRGDMVRALYEGVAFGHRAHFEILDPDRAFRTATLSGGAAKSQLWAQIFADTLGMTLRLSDCLETGARGAAIAAAIGAGLFDGFDAATGAMARHTEEITPDPAAQAQLDARYRRWCAYRDALGAAWAPPQVLAFEPRETQERTSHG